ncbi:DNA repair protein NreA [Halomarina pelagica]|uniref:DNA repair protein NreA n=1 Tax=Halomarina pelagica TaxID=2961599 RepID=UPI0020C5898E|nr:DNA repair protein NreA [Halomarina sp. BND7]
MRLDEYIDGLEVDETVRMRQLAKEKSYAITDYLADVERRVEETVQGDSLFGSTAPSIFVGRSSYPNVSAGVLAPVSDAEHAADYETSGEWYRRGFTIDDVFQARTNLLNSTQRTNVHVADEWGGFVGVQREVAIADRPVDVEVGLDGPPTIDFDAGLANVSTPTGPRATAKSAELAENPHVPRAVEKTLSDDDWRAEGAMNYLYNRGFDVYDINRILSAGALGTAESRRLVPTRWSITAVDDTVGQYLRGRIRNAPSVDAVEVWYNGYMGNRFWVLLAPGRWEYELVEMKAPGSIWNYDPEARYLVGADYEGYEGRTGYVEETAGAYYAARLGVLEHLADRGRQAKVLVLRHVTEDYWGPTGVWMIRESVRNAFTEGGAEPGEAETFHDAIRTLAPALPIDLNRLRRSSEMASGLQATLGDYGS